MAMAIIDMAEIDIMAVGTTIEDITADIMVAVADTMAAGMDMEEQVHTEEGMRKVLTEAAETIVEVAAGMAEHVVVDMPEEAVIGAAVIGEEAELAAAVAEEEAVVAAGVVDALLQEVKGIQ